jgi:hypothetical protein
VVKISLTIFPEKLLSNLSDFGGASEQTLREAERTILQKWVVYESDAAKNWALSRDDESRHASIFAVAEGELSTDPQTSLDWLGSNVEEPDRPHAMAYLIDLWSSFDQQAAGEWLQNHQDDPAIESAFQNYALKINGQNPFEAKQWISRIQDDTLKNKVIEML